MRLSDISVQRPVLATVLAALIVAFGVLALDRLPLQEYPSIDPPIVSIDTDYPGASANVVETRITQVLADSDVDIRRVDIEDESAMQTTVLRFTVAVHDQLQLESALRALRRNAAVRSCSRVLAP